MNKTNNIFSLTCAGLLTALSFLAMMGANIIPTGRIALICVAAAIQCVIILEVGRVLGTASSAALAILILLFGTNKYLSAAYVLYFAAYPVLKSVFETNKSKKKEYIYKGAYFFITSIIGAAAAYIMFKMPIIITFLGALAIMLVGDYALSLFISFYMVRIYPYTKRINKKH